MFAGGADWLTISISYVFLASAVPDIASSAHSAAASNPSTLATRGSARFAGRPAFGMDPILEGPPPPRFAKAVGAEGEVIGS